ncbi:uncharacterized protein [Eurosta solidaginis]|uniref:uncharacterized protein isoform X2 n=2 Tax=Eurosta solidaginis TaxID=178769 RepID=UPI00353099E4
MGKCCLCNIRREKAGVKLFTVPQDPRKRKNWEKACGVKFPQNGFICSLHFQASDLIVGAQRVNLMPNSTPSLYLPAFMSTNQEFVKNESCLVVPNRNSYGDLPKFRTILSPLQSEPFISNMKENDTFGAKSQYLARKNCSTQTDIHDVQQISCETQTHEILLQCAMESEITRLRVENLKLREENEKLKGNIANTAIVMSAVESVFTEGQMQKMLLRGKCFPLPCIVYILIGMRRT